LSYGLMAKEIKRAERSEWKILRDHSGKSVRLTEERLRHILQHLEMANIETAEEAR